MGCNLRPVDNVQGEYKLILQQRLSNWQRGKHEKQDQPFERTRPAVLLENYVDGAVRYRRRDSNALSGPRSLTEAKTRFAASLRRLLKFF